MDGDPPFDLSYYSLFTIFLLQSWPARHLHFQCVRTSYHTLSTHPLTYSYANTILPYHPIIIQVGLQDISTFGVSVRLENLPEGEKKEGSGGGLFGGLLGGKKKEEKAGAAEDAEVCKGEPKTDM